MTHYEELARYLPLVVGIELAFLVRLSARAQSSTSWLVWPRPRGSRATSRRIRSAMDWRQSLSADEYVNPRCKQFLDTLHPRQRESTFTSRPSKSPTNIKTPSGNTDLPAIPRRIRQVARWSLITFAVCVILSGCSSGAARDAARDEARDAGLEDQLAAQQATRIVQRYFPPTGTPAPTQPPVPALGQIAVTFGFRPDGTPDGSYASVPAGAGSVYVATKLTGLSVGQKVHAIVTDAWGNEVAKPEVVIDPGAADRWLALPVPLPAELAPGEYGVFIFADDHPLGSLAFGVTGVGTSAQLLPEMPANPQARNTVPPPGAAPAAEQPTPADGQEAPTVAPSG